MEGKTIYEQNLLKEKGRIGRSFRCNTDLRCSNCNNKLQFARGYDGKFFTDMFICDNCNEFSILGTFVAINDYFLLKGE